MNITLDWSRICLEFLSLEMQSLFLQIWIWVDNPFSVSESPGGTIQILADFEARLSSEWHLQIKETHVETFAALGHLLQANVSIRHSRTGMRKAMWKSVWANPGAPQSQDFGLQQNFVSLSRAVVPQLNFQCSRWPPQRQIAKEIDNLQQQIIVPTLLKVPRSDGEELENYIRRRAKSVRRVCAQNGMWFLGWFRRVLDWDEHLQRPRNGETWAAILRT